MLLHGVWTDLVYQSLGVMIDPDPNKIYRTVYAAHTVWVYFEIASKYLINMIDNGINTSPEWISNAVYRAQYNEGMRQYKIGSRAKITDIMVSLIKDRFVQRGTLKIPPAASASDYTLTYQYPFETVPTLEFANNNAYDATVTTTGATIRLSAHTETMFLDWIAWTE
jgi:hypothetical protein